MVEIDTLIVLIPALPLAAAVLIALLGPRVLKGNSHWPAVLAIIGSCVCSLLLVNEVSNRQSGTEQVSAAGYEHIVTLWTWADVEDAYHLAASQSSRVTNSDGGWRHFRIDVALRADALTAMMLAMVTFISSLVAIFAAGYMRGDRGYWRFFSYIALFVFSMTMLVSVSNFVLLFVFWEAVGMCSYLLIGFWYQKPEAAAAGKKAFLVNRIGDFGFALAVFLIWTNYGTLNFHDTTVDGAPTTSASEQAQASGTTREIPSNAVRGVLGPSRIAANDYLGGTLGLSICLLLMLGACGKSAQFPLHIWLPDAMEGPTPVSALIHAATMVTAGVYLVVRCTPLFMASPDAQLVVAVIGGFTALLAGLIALTQHDLKRVLAYSTVSQLGFMFLSLGTGTLAGITAGMFHLFTHAFFKALLFLGAGSVMHAMGNVIDMRRFGGLRHLLPHTHAVFFIGCLALAGVPPLAGFWSKDSIVAAVHDKAHALQHELEHRQHADSPNGAQVHLISTTATSGSAPTAENPLARPTDAQLRQGHLVFQYLFYAALITAFLTAFYTFRAFLLTFYGEYRVPHEAGHHAHESSPIMVVPLYILAFCAIFVGMYFDRTYATSLPADLRHGFASFLGHAPSLAAGAVHNTPALDQFHLDIAGISTVVALAGIGLALYLYLGDSREVRFLTSLMNLDGLSRWLGVDHVARWRNQPAIASLQRGASQIGLGWLTAFLGYFMLLVALLVSAPLLLGQYVSPYRLSYRKFFWDEIYDVTIVKPLRFLARMSDWLDRWLVDGLVNLCGCLPGTIGSLLRSLQIGLVPFYALAMVVGALLLIAARWIWAAG